LPILITSTTKKKKVVQARERMSPPLLSGLYFRRSLSIFSPFRPELGG